MFAVESIGFELRGFALTGKESYLESDRTGLLKVAQDQAAIRHLTLDNPEQQRHIPLLESLTAQKIQRAETVIRLGAAPRAWRRLPRKTRRTKETRKSISRKWVRCRAKRFGCWRCAPQRLSGS